VRYRRLTDQEMAQIAQALRAGATIRAVAQQERRSLRTIWKLRQALEAAGQVARARLGRPPVA
jgi:Helix-turn-helix domain